MDRNKKLFSTLLSLFPIITHTYTPSFHLSFEKKKHIEKGRKKEKKR